MGASHVDASIRVKYGTKEVTYASDVIQSFEITQSMCASGVFTLGSTVSGQLNVTILTSAVEEGYITDKARIGVNFTFKRYSMAQVVSRGYFYVDGSTIQDNGMFSSFTAYDLFMSEGMAEPISDEYLDAFDETKTPQANITAFNRIYPSYAITIGNISGTGAATGVTPVQVDQTLSVRDVIGRLALSLGANAYIEQGGEIVIATPAKETRIRDRYTADSYQSCLIDGKDNTCVTYIAAKAGDTTTQYPPAVLIQSNASNIGLMFDETFLTDTSTETLKGIYDHFAVMQDEAHAAPFFGYQGFSVDLVGIDLGLVGLANRYSIVDIKNKTYSIVPLTIKYTYNGGLTVRMEASTINQTNNIRQGTVAQTISATNAIANNAISEVSTRTTAVFAECGTAAGVSAKVASCAGFSLYNGAPITILFNSTNEANNPTLDVNGTGAKPIYANQSPLIYPSPYTWEAGQLVSFVYHADTASGEEGAWHMVSANPANFCDFVEDGSGKVLRISTDASAEGFHTDIGASSIELKSGATTQLKIESDGVTIGGSTAHQMQLTSGGVSITNGSTKVTLGNANLTLTAFGSQSSQTVLDASQLKTAVVAHQQAKFYNDTSTTYTYVMEHRANGHLSFKAIAN